MKKNTGHIGLLTLGNSPRNDITPSLRAILGQQIPFQEIGALDRLGNKEIKALAPTAKETGIETRLGCGSAVLLSKERLIPHLIEAALLLRKKCRFIVLLCSGEFPLLKKACPEIIEPVTILRSIVGALVGNGTLGVVGPESDLALAPFQWQNHVNRVVCAAASPYVTDDMVVTAVSDVVAAGAQAVVLDDMGFTEAHRLLARTASEVPIICATTLIGRILGELI